MNSFILKFVNHLQNHVERIFTTSYGYFLIAVSTFFNILQPDWRCFVVVLTLVFFDLFWGICASIKLGGFVLSRLIRNTFTKLGGYAFSLIGILLIEGLLHDSGLIGIKLAAALAAACELWSMSASILIVYPNFPFLKILRLQLKGEIESKTGKNLDNILNDQS